MSSNYPGALDDFSESSPTYMADPDATGRTHEGRHNDVESAVEAVQGTLGVNPQGSSPTVGDALADRALITHTHEGGTGLPLAWGNITGDIAAQDDLDSALAAKLTTPGAWTDYTPALSATSGSFTSAVVTQAKYVQLGKVVHCHFLVTITTNGTAAGSIVVSLPVTGVSSNGNSVGQGRDNGVSGKMLQILQNALNCTIQNYDGTYPGVNGATLFCSLTYEAA